MDELFKLPTGYACLQKNTANLYAFSSDYRTRDTFEFDNFQWLQVRHETNSYGYSASSCLPSDTTHLVPESLEAPLTLGFILSALALCAALFRIFSR